MPTNSRGLIILSVLMLLAGKVFGDSPKVIQINEYKSWNYTRHPRMEEEDYRRQRLFEYQPGLEIITDVDGVRILLSDEEVGRTPWEQSNQEPGLYQVRLILRSFELGAFPVTVYSDRRTVATIAIGEPEGTLILRDMPSGAEIEIDGVPYTGNEISLRAGKRRLRITAFGWETNEAVIEISPGRRVEWHYSGARKTFEFGEFKIVPKSLPPNDWRGFRINWIASSSGQVKLKILGPGNELITEIPLRISTPQGSINWRPMKEDGNALADGRYRIAASGIGRNGSSGISTTSLIIDSRFRREARLMQNTLPGLLYAPGTSMLPPGVWQTATGIAASIGNPAASSEFPVTAGFRISPASRWEISARFGVRVRNAFDAASIHTSLSGSWRINPKPGPLETNLALLFSHDGLTSGFGRIPQTNSSMILPGFHLLTPMEISFAHWNLILSPTISLTFVGPDNENWRLASPVRTVQSLSLGAYHESEQFMVGLSTAFRGPDLPGGFLDLALLSGLEGRFDLPGDASYLAVFIGVCYLNADPVASVGIELGLTG